MKPKLKTYKVEYWTCMNAKHRHTTIVIAQACIDKRLRILAAGDARKGDFGTPWTDEQFANLLADRRAGMTLEALGKRHRGLTKERIRQALWKAERREDMAKRRAERQAQAEQQAAA